jgi:hypothetical protein
MVSTAKTSARPRQAIYAGTTSDSLYTAFDDFTLHPIQPAPITVVPMRPKISIVPQERAEIRRVTAWSSRINEKVMQILFLLPGHHSLQRECTHSNQFTSR